MLNTKKSILSIFIVLFFSVNFTFAEDIGKIFSKSEADNLFGPVLESKEMSASYLEALLLETNQYVMFLLKDNQITILGDERKLLYTSGTFTENNQVFHMYSINKVLELINKEGKENVSFENRKDVFSITIGNYTLEYSDPCPPRCG